MTNSIIPYSFAPGTKAKAQEVNANFNALAEKIEENNSTAIHENSNTTISGNLTFSKQINSTAKCRDTSGSLTILNLAEGEIRDVILARNDKSKNSTALRIINGTNYNEITITAYNEDGTTKKSMGLRNTNGVTYAYAPTYTTNYADSSDRIVTTAFMANHWTTSVAGTTSTASKTRPGVVTQNYKNGNSWYRVYSDGWIEQGGTTGTVNAHTSKTITFVKAFTSASCTVLFTQGGWNDSYSRSDTGITAITKSNFTIGSTSGSSGLGRWYACGY